MSKCIHCGHEKIEHGPLSDKCPIFVFDNKIKIGYSDNSYFETDELLKKLFPICEEEKEERFDSEGRQFE
jgi:hypothetical protein